MHMRHLFATFLTKTMLANQVGYFIFNEIGVDYIAYLLMNYLRLKLVGAINSLIQLKLKYYNVHDEPTTINVNLFGEKRIYKALQQDQK